MWARSVAPWPEYLDGSASKDTDSSVPLTFDWNWGDGTAHGTGATPTHTFCPGTYTVTLAVTDVDGWSAPPLPQTLTVVPASC